MLSVMSMVRAMPEIAFHGVHENIHAAAGRLKGRQRHGQLGIHERQRPGRAISVLKLRLEAVFLVGHNS